MSNLAVLGGKPVGEPVFPRWPIWDDQEAKAINEVLNSGMWGTGGPKQVAFEEAYAEYCGTKYGVMLTNGTHTLRVALEALGIGPGDEVLVPGTTWQATASSVLDVNAVPVLCDVDPDTWNISLADAERKVNKNTKAIIPVHLYGRVVDMDALLEFAVRHGLRVIEDCSHQQGSEWKGKKVGSMGDIGSFSLQADKILTTGEGGICITADETLYERMYSLKSCGRRRNKDVTVPPLQSGNFRPHEFAAAIALCQLQRLDSQNDTREANARYFEDTLCAEVPGFTYLKRDDRVTKQAYYRISFNYDAEAWDGVKRATLLRALHFEIKDGVMSSPYKRLNDSALYRPLSKHTHKLSDEYMALINPARFSLPNVEKISDVSGINFHHRMLLATKKELDICVEALKKLYDNRGELLKNAATIAETIYK